MNSRIRRFCVLALVGLVLTLIVTTLVAQEQDAAKSSARPDTISDGGKAADNAATDGAAGGDSILQMILGSGPTGMVFMALLGVFSIVAGTVAVERTVKMQRERILPTPFLEGLQELTDQGDAPVEAYRELCASTDAPVATVIGAGLPRFGSTVSEIEKALEDAAAREMAEIRAKIKPLSTIGSIAPLVGLLGTVVGMIVAFHTASQEGLGKAELLAKGIYMALLTTAGGLSVAIPSLMLAAFFSSRAERFFRQMDRHLMLALPRLAGNPMTLMRSKIEAAAGGLGARSVNPPAATPAAPPKATLTAEVAASESLTGTVRGDAPPQAAAGQSPAIEQTAEAAKSDELESKKTSSSSPASSRSKNNPLMPS